MGMVHTDSASVAPQRAHQPARGTCQSHGAALAYPECQAYPYEVLTPVGFTGRSGSTGQRPIKLLAIEPRSVQNECAGPCSFIVPELRLRDVRLEPQRHAVQTVESWRSRRQRMAATYAEQTHQAYGSANEDLAETKQEARQKVRQYPRVSWRRASQARPPYLCPTLR